MSHINLKLNIFIITHFPHIFFLLVIHSVSQARPQRGIIYFSVYICKRSLCPGNLTWSLFNPYSLSPMSTTMQVTSCIPLLLPQCRQPSLFKIFASVLILIVPTNTVMVMLLNMNLIIYSLS